MKKIRNIAVLTIIIAMILVVSLSYTTNFLVRADFALDAHGENKGGSVTSLTLPITTTGTNDIVYVVAYAPQKDSVSLSISDNTGTLIWHDRMSNEISVHYTGSQYGRVHIWYVISTAAITSKTITITQSVSGSLAIMFVAVKGVDTNHPFDPAFTSTTPSYLSGKGSGANVPLTFSVTNNKDFVVGFLWGDDNAYSSVSTNYQLIGNGHGNSVSATSEYNSAVLSSGSVSPGFTVTNNKYYILMADAFAPVPATLASFTIDVPGSATAGAGFGGVVVKAYDANNNLKTDYTGTVTFSSATDAQFVASPSTYTFVSGDAGSHTISGTPFTFKTVGSQTMKVTDGSVSKTSSAIAVNPASATTLVVSGFTSPTVAGAAHSVTVEAKDAFNNRATGYVGTVHFTSGDGQAVLPSNYLFVSGDSGIHTFTNGVTLKTVGSQSIIATDTVTGTITGSQTGIQVNAASLDHFDFATIGTQTAGTGYSITVTAKDSSGNTVTSYTGNPILTSNSWVGNKQLGAFVLGTQTGSVTSTVAGTLRTIVATDGITGTSNTFTVNKATTTLTVSCSPNQADKLKGEYTLITMTLTSGGTGVPGKSIDLTCNDGHVYTVGAGSFGPTDGNGVVTYKWYVPSEVANGYYVLKAEFVGTNDPTYDESIGQRNSGYDLNVVPEYLFGGLAALGACFVGLAVFKKRSSLLHFKRQ